VFVVTDVGFQILLCHSSV